jgi:glycosyltransferase involved in cell wall biosynthesis
VAGAVRSALAQDGARLEVCVVDDGSSEPVVLPTDLATDPRVTLIRLAAPSGSAAARNAGLAATSADLVAFLDDDDVWLPGKLERQVAALRAGGPGTVMVACGFEVWEGSRLVAAAVPPAGVNSGELLAHPCVWPSTVLVRRSAVEAAGGFDESLARAQDWDLWLRIADLGEIAVVPEVLVDRRWTPLPLTPARVARAQIAPRLEARLRHLPVRDAARLRARRGCDDGVLLARLGQRRQAAATLVAAWRAWPRSRGPALGLARVLAGERAWQHAARAAAPVRAALRRRPPRPPGPAPAWAGR